MIDCPVGKSEDDDACYERKKLIAKRDRSSERKRESASSEYDPSREHRESDEIASNCLVSYGHHSPGTWSSDARAWIYCRSSCGESASDGR